MYLLMQCVQVCATSMVWFKLLNLSVTIIMWGMNIATQFSLGGQYN